MYDLYCHIWLNFPEDDHHYFYILLFTIAILVTLNIPQKILIYIFWKKVKIYLFSFLWYQKFEFFIKNLRKISQMYIRKKKKKLFNFFVKKWWSFTQKKNLVSRYLFSQVSIYSNYVTTHCIGRMFLLWRSYGFKI